MAKKKYYQSTKDRMDESRGMEREIRRKDVKKAFKRGKKMGANKKNGKNNYYDYMDSYDSRRNYYNGREGMIHEDKNEVANLPQNVKYVSYPKTDYFSYNLNDNIHGVDVQIDDDVRKEKAKVGKKYPQKY